MKWSLFLPAVVGFAAACTPPSGEPTPLHFTAATFNTGTSDGLPHDDVPDDGYTSDQAATADLYYGNGLAWRPVIAGRGGTRRLTLQNGRRAPHGALLLQQSLRSV